jgi:hypothetical protein
MADPDKLLADVREALRRFKQAAGGPSGDGEHAAGADLAGSVEAIDEHMKAAGLPPADWLYRAEVEAATQRVLDNWESGDLASAVNELETVVFAGGQPRPGGSARSPA